jgi:hypothetical protein
MSFGKETPGFTSMKHSRDHDNAGKAGLQLVPVRFECAHPAANIVCVAATFNVWPPESKAMGRHFVVELAANSTEKQKIKRTFSDPANTFRDGQVSW